jgi:hypothetical protein
MDATTVTLSTFTDPNGRRHTILLKDGAVWRNERGHAPRQLKGNVRALWEHVSAPARLVRWDGDHKLKHVLATK